MCVCALIFLLFFQFVFIYLHDGIFLFCPQNSFFSFQLMIYICLFVCVCYSHEVFPIHNCSVATRRMAHYYIQSLDDNIKLYTTTDVQVVHVAGDDVGVSNPNRAQVHSFNNTNIIYLILIINLSFCLLSLTMLVFAGVLIYFIDFFLK